MIKYRHMRKFELLEHTADVAVKVLASTKAGLAIAAVQGMFAAAEPRLGAEDAPDVKRPFDVSGEDFPSLLVNLLNEAVSLGNLHHERYQDISFALITDKKAEGEFVGKPVAGFGTEIKAATHHDLKVEKNVNGEWETVITFDV